MNKNLFLLFAVVFLLVGIIGCSDHVGLSGKVVYSDNGEPVPSGEIQFTTPTFLARAIIRNGSFTTGSYKEGDGLPPGTYNVAIVSVMLDEGNPEAAPKFLIDPKYADSKTSGLNVTIEATTRNFEFKVDRAQ